MATRVLPGVYVSLNDMSQFPEGSTSLKVGYVVKANRGPVNEWSLVTSPSDFLTKYTFSGKPSISDDPTFHSILKVLAKTNSVYVVRAANNPLYGGIVVKKAVDYGKVAAANKTNKTITITGDVAPAAGEFITVSGTGLIDGYYTVVSVASKVITVKENVAVDIAAEVENSRVVRQAVQPLSAQTIGAVVSATASTKTFVFEGDLLSKFTVGSQFVISGADEEENNGTFTVSSASVEEGNTSVVVIETIVDSSTIAGSGDSPNHGVASFGSLVSPAGYVLGADDLMLITGINPGAYNGKIAFTIISALDNPSSLVYENTMQLNVINSETNEILETFTFSRDEDAKAIDGTSLFVDSIVQGSAYIKITNNADNKDLPSSTLSGSPVLASGGSDGGEVDENVLTAALDVFKDKTIPVSIIGNGCSAQAENALFQQALIELADDRKDMMCFLNSRKADEKATLPSERITNIVNYKKSELGSTSFYGCMYAPHVKTSDTFNQRQVEIGSDAVAIAGWLDVINTLDFPYAYAGPRNGLVSGVTTDWKIGDTSGEAEALNDASINYVAFDGKVGRYYMQTQNTLQVANSAMRNIGAVLNVLDIKEHLADALKEYINLPITDLLRADILNTCNDYLAPMQGTRFYNYVFQDVTTDADLAQDTLRYLGTFSITRYAQKIYVVMNIVNSTFDFSILQSI